ncbi:MAG: hypothetical protein ACXAB4_06630, partial [Candidatus Hodarchaeales archaeon]
MILGRISDIAIMKKLTAAFVLIAALSGVVGVFGILQLNTLDSTIVKITDVNVEQADGSMETIIALETQVMTIHAIMLGESEAQEEFNAAHDVMTEGFEELADLLAGTTQEASVSVLEAQYLEFANTVTDPVTGLFTAMDGYTMAAAHKDTQFQRIDERQDGLDAQLALLEKMVVHYAEHNATPFEPNATLVDNAMELNLLMWRCGDRARMYMATALNDSAAVEAERATIRAEYADEASILTESPFILNGLEKDFTDRLAEADTNFAQASSTGQFNGTGMTILANVRESFVFDPSTQSRSFADSVRSQEDGVFMAQDDAVRTWVSTSTAMETADSLAGTLIVDLEALETWVGEE